MYRWIRDIINFWNAIPTEYVEKAEVVEESGTPDEGPGNAVAVVQAGESELKRKCKEKEELAEVLHELSVLITQLPVCVSKSEVISSIASVISRAEMGENEYWYYGGNNHHSGDFIGTLSLIRICEKLMKNRDDHYAHILIQKDYSNKESIDFYMEMLTMVKTVDVLLPFEKDPVSTRMMKDYLTSILESKFHQETEKKYMNFLQDFETYISRISRVLPIVGEAAFASMMTPFPKALYLSKEEEYYQTKKAFLKKELDVAISKLTEISSEVKAKIAVYEVEHQLSTLGADIVPLEIKKELDAMYNQVLDAQALRETVVRADSWLEHQHKEMVQNINTHLKDQLCSNPS